LRDVAQTLNNLANLHSARNEYVVAQSEYEETLTIRRELVKKNLRTYLPDVAQTLNNLAILHSDRNEFPEALSAYEESLEIRRKLAAANPRAYEIDYASMLLMGIVLFEKNHKALVEARTLLNKYPQVPRAQELLEIISELEQENPLHHHFNLHSPITGNHHSYSRTCMTIRKEFV